MGTEPSDSSRPILDSQPSSLAHSRDGRRVGSRTQLTQLCFGRRSRLSDANIGLSQKGPGPWCGGRGALHPWALTSASRRWRSMREIPAFWAKRQSQMSASADVCACWRANGSVPTQPGFPTCEWRPLYELSLRCSWRCTYENVHVMG